MYVSQWASGSGYMALGQERLTAVGLGDGPSTPEPLQLNSHSPQCVASPPVTVDNTHKQYVLYRRDSLILSYPGIIRPEITATLPKSTCVVRHTDTSRAAQKYLRVDCSSCQSFSALVRGSATKL